MSYEQANTLAQLETSPFRRIGPIDVSAQDFGNLLVKVNKSDASTLPDSEACRFYAFNQLTALLYQKFTPNERLPDWAAEIANSYHQEMVAQHRRLVRYTFIVITREFRHLSSAGSFFNKHKYPETFAEFHSSISDSTNPEVLNSWLAKVPNLTLSDYCDWITLQFNEGSYGGGYGGKPWGQISNALGQYIGGHTSAEMFIDTAYTLAHNNGPMFNKGMLYAMYKSTFKKILDVQRGGMVCEGFLDGTWDAVGVVGHAEIKAMITTAKSELGGIENQIDWQKVQDLGALETYVKKTPKPPKPKNLTEVIGGVKIKLHEEHFLVTQEEPVTFFERVKE